MSEALQVRRTKDAIERVRAAVHIGEFPRLADVDTVLTVLDEALLELGLRRLVDQAQIAAAEREGGAE